MKNTVIIYGSTTGTTENVAHKLAKLMGVDEKDVVDVKNIAPSQLGNYDNIIAGSSTWGSGELQDDWFDFVDGLKALDLPGKKVAIFGCGDETMGDTFCGAVATLYEAFKSTGATMVGAFDIVGYDVTSTPAEIDGTIVGLLLDEVNHPEATDLRLRKWAQLVADEFAK